MQEEVENRTVAIIVSSTKLTGRVLGTAMNKYLAYRKEKNHDKKLTGTVKPMGKQTVKQLVGQNQGVSNIKIDDKSIRAFDRVARKYGVDYAVKKDRSTTPPRYLVFFKARDVDALTAAFQEYSNRALQKKDRASVINKLRGFKPLVKSMDKNKGFSIR